MPVQDTFLPIQEQLIHFSSWHLLQVTHILKKSFRGFLEIYIYFITAHPDQNHCSHLLCGHSDSWWSAVAVALPAAVSIGSDSCSIGPDLLLTDDSSLDVRRTGHSQTDHQCNQHQRHHNTSCYTATLLQDCYKQAAAASALLLWHRIVKALVGPDIDCFKISLFPLNIPHSLNFKFK